MVVNPLNVDKSEEKQLDENEGIVSAVNSIQETEGAQNNYVTNGEMIEMNDIQRNVLNISFDDGNLNERDLKELDKWNEFDENKSVEKEEFYQVFPVKATERGLEDPLSTRDIIIP